MFQPVFKTGNRRIKPAVAGSIPALSALFFNVEIMKSNLEELKNLPAVDKILLNDQIKSLIEEYNRELVKISVNKSLDFFRKKIKANESLPNIEEIVNKVKSNIKNITEKKLCSIINASGIVIHTNLGRSPFNNQIVKQVANILVGYNNLEFDLKTGQRDSRNAHLSEILKYLTGAEDVLVVNNNAAALMLILRTFSKNKEAIVSRGELIEIGGSFRLPEILAASDCIMKEVGTTNKTKISDYENNINENTAILLKAHTSNYVVQGFTKEVNLSELVALGKKYHLPVVYDMGSGLLNKKSIGILKDEPDVKQTLAKGIDLVCFSGDKLLGGPQAGIIAGKSEMIAKLKKEPLTRALRVGKITLAFLEASCQNYLNEHKLLKNNPVFNMLTKNPEQLKKNAQLLFEKLKKINLNTIIVKSKGQCGGGSLPGKEIDSYSLKINKDNLSNKERSKFAEKMYFGLLHHDNPVLGVLKKGDIYFDLLTIPEDEIEKTAEIILDVYKDLIT